MCSHIKKGVILVDYLTDDYAVANAERRINKRIKRARKSGKERITSFDAAARKWDMDRYQERKVKIAALTFNND